MIEVTEDLCGGDQWAEAELLQQQQQHPMGRALR